MAEVLLEELTDRDIEWLVSAGHQKELTPNTVLIQQNTPVDAFYIIFNGNLTVAVADDKESALGRAFSAISGDSNLEQELLSLGDGDIVGELAVLRNTDSPLTVRVTTASTVLLVPRERLQVHLKEDSDFAARFYRAIAILLLNRYEFLLDKFIHRRGIQLAPLQDGPVIFGELYDSDVNWMIEHGTIQQVAPGTSLIQANRPADTLYIVLQGLLSTSIIEERSATLTKVFARLATAGQSEAPLGREIARSSRGEMVGETTLIDSRLSKFAVSAIESSVLLAIPRRDLFIKLQQDPAMSARFYRVLTVLLSERLTSLINRLGYGKRSYQSGQSLASGVTYEDELDLDLVDNLTIGGARFDWMLKRLKVGNA
jgi:CRP-like cAMP-binding protein